MKKFFLTCCIIGYLCSLAQVPPPPLPKIDSIYMCSNDSIFFGKQWRHTPGRYYDSIDLGVINCVDLMIYQAPEPHIIGPDHVSDDGVYGYYTMNYPYHNYAWEIIGGEILTNSGNSITVQWKDTTGILRVMETDTNDCLGYAMIVVTNRSVKPQVLSGIETFNASRDLGYFYPNPSPGDIYVSGEHLDVYIYNILGTLIESRKKITGRIKISLDPGIYLIDINSRVQKLIIY